MKRLTALADRAEREGLVETARDLRTRANARDDEIQSSIVDRAEAQMKAQRIASAALRAHSAKTNRDEALAEFGNDRHHERHGKDHHALHFDVTEMDGCIREMTPSV